MSDAPDKVLPRSAYVRKRRPDSAVEESRVGVLRSCALTADGWRGAIDETLGRLSSDSSEQRPMTNIAVMGAGAVGCYCGGKLRAHDERLLGPKDTLVVAAGSPNARAGSSAVAKTASTRRGRS